jgi:hypothetical protein
MSTSRESKRRKIKADGVMFKSKVPDKDERQKRLSELLESARINRRSKTSSAIVQRKLYKYLNEEVPDNPRLGYTRSPIAKMLTLCTPIPAAVIDSNIIPFLNGYTQDYPVQSLTRYRLADPELSVEERRALWKQSEKYRVYCLSCNRLRADCYNKGKGQLERYYHVQTCMISLMFFRQMLLGDV